MAVGRSASRRSLIATTLALATVATLLVSGRPAAAQYLNAYKAGLDAIEAKDWGRAESSMSEALEERGEEKMKLPVKLFLRPYLPHFYLGYARFERGDCAGALAAWAESERQGVSSRLPEFDFARRGRKTCEERDRELVVAQARREAQQSLARSAAAGAALLERSREPQSRGPWSQGDPTPAARHAEGLELLEQARQLLGGATVDPMAIKRAEALIRKADQSFADVGSSLDRLTESTRLELLAKDQGIDARVADAKVALAATAYLAPYPRAVRKARADLEGLVAEAGRREGVPKAHLDGLAARLENSIEALGKLTAAPPALLEQAAEAYLEGRHGDVVEALDGARLADRRARAHARLLLAASRHALYLEGGELDDELRTAAVDDARACREEDQTLAPTQRFFSPRFIVFFTESVAAPVTPSTS